MRNTAIALLIIAVPLMLVGCALAGQYETNTYEVAEAFSDISVTTSTADIIFALSDEEKCRVECYEKENAKHSVAVENDVLVVRVDKSWYNRFGFSFSFDLPKITIYLPKTEYNALSIDESTGNVEIPKDYLFENVDISTSTGDVDFCASVSESARIETTTGNIRVENISAGALDLSATTGKVNVSGVTCRDDITVEVSTGEAYLTDISCRSVISDGTTGSMSLSNVIAADKLSVERSTGDVEFSSCDAGEIYVETSTGNVTGSFLSDKVMFRRSPFSATTWTTLFSRSSRR